VKNALSIACLIVTALSAFAEDASKPPLPPDFPALGWFGVSDMLVSSFGGMESEFTRIEGAASNREFWQRLHKYSRESISNVMGKRMADMREIHMKLALAAIAAKAGNENARKFIEQTEANRDFEITHSRLSALKYLLWDDHAPDWVINSASKALRDQHTMVGGRDYRQNQPVSKLAEDEVLYAMDHRGDSRAVPVLMELATRPGGCPIAVRNLGKIGDPRAIPICLGLLRRDEETIKKNGRRDHPGTTEFMVLPEPENTPSPYIIDAIADLKVKEAVPRLLHYLNSMSAINALGDIGDQRAVEPLRKVVADERANPDLVFTARMSLIKLESDDPIPQWLDLVKETKRDERQRFEALKEIADHPDARSVPALLEVIQSDSTGMFVWQCIRTLRAFRYKSAVLGLIDCLDKDFQGHETRGKAHIANTRSFRESIAEALAQLTDRDFGTDKNRWMQWWEATGKDLKALQ
jgi:HEAT repeat protein